MPRKLKDYTGLVYGKLTIKEARPVNEKISTICVCGTVKMLRIQDVVTGKTKSCGCASKELRSATNVDRFGVVNTFSSTACKEKAKQTMNRLYGVDNPAQSGVFKKKIKDTNEERYGGPSPASCQNVRDKIVATNNLKYGTDYGLQNSEVRGKILDSQAKSGHRSVGENELKNWIEETFGLEVRPSKCGGDKPFQIDLYIESKNIAIEYNGEYWHSEANKRGRSYHKHKTDLVAKQKNSQLIHIFDQEWMKNKDAVKSFLSGKLSKQTPIRASKCEVKVIARKEADHLFVKHLQGIPKNSIKVIGLFHNGELVSAMSFSLPHRQNMTKERHLSRYVVKDGVRVHGGLSKMSQFAKKEVGDFITFIHKRLANADSYLKAGYTFVKDLAPDYWYFDTNKKKAVAKQSRKKSVVNTPEGKSESEHAREDGLVKIWDCGKIKLKF